jgi:hypothetical protein
MNKRPIKAILLEALKVMERTLESDLAQDEHSNKTLKKSIHILRYVAVDAIESLAIQGEEYIKEQIKVGAQISAKKIAIAIESLIYLIGGFFIIGIGLVFGAVALSLYLGELFGSNALGFLASGILWITIIIVILKIMFKPKKLEALIFKKLIKQ